LGWLVLGALLVGLGLAHRPLLRLAAGALVADDSDGGAPWLVPFDDGQVYTYAAERCRADAETRVLLIERAPDRLQALVGFPSWAEERRRMLLARGVAARAVEVLPAATEDDWDGARALRGWLADHPGARVAVLCDRFRSRRLRIVFDRVLGPDADRARVVAVPDRRYDETNWWRSKDGLVGWWDGFVSLGYTGLIGEGNPPTPLWDPDAYERGLP
jgi:hypothetical protein